MANAARVIDVIVLCALLAPGAVAAGQSAASQTQTEKPPVASPAPTVPVSVEPPPGYVIGTDDVLSVVFWREKDLSAEVVVRPDGMITLPLLNDILVVGLTPAELREKVMAEANKLVEDPNATVIVKEINSRKVFITGFVAKPGSYSLTGPMTVVQLIALAGGLLEFADASKVRVMRVEKGVPTAYRVNYERVAEGRNLRENIELKPGDTVIVP